MHGDSNLANAPSRATHTHLTGKKVSSLDLDPEPGLRVSVSLWIGVHACASCSRSGHTRFCLPLPPKKHHSASANASHRHPLDPNISNPLLPASVLPSVPTHHPVTPSSFSDRIHISRMSSNATLSTPNNGAQIKASRTRGASHIVSRRHALKAASRSSAGIVC